MTGKNEQVETKAEVKIKATPAPAPKTVHAVTTHSGDTWPHWSGCSCGWKSDGYYDTDSAVSAGSKHLEEVA